MNFKAAGGEAGISWALPGVAYEGKDTEKYGLGVSAKLGVKAGSLSVNVPLPFLPVKLVAGGEYGAGFELTAGYMPGSKKLFNASAALGWG